MDLSTKDLSSSIVKALALNVLPPSGPTIWNALVLDQFTKDVIATVLRVRDLGGVRVTLHVYTTVPRLPNSLRGLNGLHYNRPPPLQCSCRLLFVALAL